MQVAFNLPAGDYTTNGLKDFQLFFNRPTTAEDVANTVKLLLVQDSETIVEEGQWVPGTQYVEFFAPNNLVDLKIQMTGSQMAVIVEGYDQTGAKFSSFTPSWNIDFGEGVEKFSVTNWALPQGDDYSAGNFAVVSWFVNGVIHCRAFEAMNESEGRTLTADGFNLGFNGASVGPDAGIQNADHEIEHIVNAEYANPEDFYIILTPANEGQQPTADFATFHNQFPFLNFDYMP